MKHPIAEDTATQALPTRLFTGVRDKMRAKRVQDELEKIELGLQDQLGFASPIADAPARYLLEAGGKRIRPVLTVVVSELGDGSNDLVRAAAMSVELTHLASLYHDDVMDEATVRRGVPAAHMVWNNQVAILAGDLLFARASSLVSGMGERAIMLQAKTFERLCLGQLHETVGPQEGEDPIKHYIQVLADKTGALIATAARMGIMFSNAPAEYEDPVTEYGEMIGVAFQLIDDVIDLSPKPEATGKRAGTDLRAGVATLPMLLLRKRALTNPADAELLTRIDRGVAEAQEHGESAELEQAIADLWSHDVTAETEREARRWTDAAIAAIEVLPKKSGVHSALVRFAESIVDREG